MTERERLLEILNVPIFPHEKVDPLEAVADYLLDNGVMIPVQCRYCKHYDEDGDYCRIWCGVRHQEHFCGEGEWEDDDL